MHIRMHVGVALYVLFFCTATGRSEEPSRESAWETGARMTAVDIEWAFRAPMKKLILMASQPQRRDIDVLDVDQLTKRHALVAIIETRNAAEVAHLTWVLIALTIILAIPAIAPLRRCLTSISVQKAGRSKRGSRRT